MSIKIKLTLLLSAALSLASIIISANFVFHQSDELRTDLKNQGIEAATNLASESRFGVLTENIGLLEPLALKKLNNPNIIYIRFSNDQNKIISAHARAKESPLISENFEQEPSESNPSNNLSQVTLFVNRQTPQNDFYRIRAPIVRESSANLASIEQFDALTNAHHNEPISKAARLGHIELDISLAHIQKKRENSINFSIATVLGVFLITLLPAYFLVRNLLTPLLIMSGMAKKITENQFNQVTILADSMISNIDHSRSKQLTLKATANDELGSLIQAFITMSGKIKSHSHDLETRVSKRTHDLQEALQSTKELQAGTVLINQQLTASNLQLTLFKRCIEASSELIFITDKNWVLTSCNRALLARSGLSLDLVKGRPLRSFLNDQEKEIVDTQITPIIRQHNKWQGQLSFRDHSNASYPVHLNLNAIHDGNTLVAFMGIARDISLEQARQRELEALANKDPLTGLYNRRRFIVELDDAISHCKRNNQELALLWLDLDQFKEINDSMGHPVGDKLLIELAVNLTALTRDSDVIARMGGDEFAILLSNNGLEKAKKGVNRIMDGLRNSTHIFDGFPVKMLSSIGVSMFPHDASSSHDLLACADIALYQAKHSGRNQFSFYNAIEHKTLTSDNRLGWRQQIQLALDENRFSLYSQAIVDLRLAKTKHHELLLRMHNEAGEIVLPSLFIAAAERNGQMHDIDRWVVQQSSTLYAKSGFAEKNEGIAINLSSHALSDESFAGFIKQEFSASGIRPENVMIEITENNAITDFNKATNFISELKKAGFKIALDDFGVGFASLRHLQNLDIDYIKIDGSFITSILENTKDQGIVRAILAIAKEQKIACIAEWVESSEVSNFLRELGVDYGQGFHFGKPKPMIQQQKPQEAASMVEDSRP